MWPQTITRAGGRAADKCCEGLWASGEPESRRGAPSAWTMTGRKGPHMPIFQPIPRMLSSEKKPVPEKMPAE